MTNWQEHISAHLLTYPSEYTQPIGKDDYDSQASDNQDQSEPPSSDQ